MDQWYHVNANDLYEDEVTYELAIRHLPVEGSLSTRMRNLRQALREPEKEVIRMVIDYSFREDYPVITNNLKEIVHRMENRQERGCWSRLVHYHKRVRRYVGGNREELQRQNDLLDIINNLSLKYYQQDMNQMISKTELFLVVKSPTGKLPVRNPAGTPPVTSSNVSVTASEVTSTVANSNQVVTVAEDGAHGGSRVSSAEVVTSASDLSLQMFRQRDRLQSCK